MPFMLRGTQVKNSGGEGMGCFSKKSGLGFHDVVKKFKGVSPFLGLIADLLTSFSKKF